MNPINNTVFSPHEGLTFDDVVLVPGFSDVLPDQVDVRTQLTSEITLAVPLLSAAMDKVTEAPMAIAMARLGGIGILHRNMSIEDQAAEARRVKRSQSGMISDPVTLGPDASLQEAEDLMRRFRFSGVPIIDKAGVLVGILTNRDIRFCEPADFRRPVSDFMTKAPLVTGNEDTTLAEAQTIIQKHRIEKLPLVDKDGHLVGIITVKDIMKKRDYPDATHDDLGRLRVGAAVGVGPDLEDRVEALMKSSIDVVVIDTALPAASTTLTCEVAGISAAVSAGRAGKNSSIAWRGLPGRTCGRRRAGSMARARSAR